LKTIKQKKQAYQNLNKRGRREWEDLLGVGLVVDDGSAKDHGAHEAIEEQGLPVLLDTLGASREGLVEKLGSK